MKRLTAVLAAGLLLAGCGAKAETSQTEAAAQTTAEMPAGHPQIDDSAPGTAAKTIAGTVVETMNGGGYTYMRIAKDDGGEDWVAVPQTEVQKDQKVVVNTQMTMTNFESSALGRTFDSLVFATMGGPGASPHGGSGMQMPPGMAEAMANRKPVDIGDVKVDKAEGPDARTVEELWAQRTDLVDKTVVVRGKVVKFLPQIMGRNWVHLRDGTGNEKAANNDITVTTSEAVAVGDVVIAKGVVRIDKDLGMGYSYPVILEEGTFTK